MKAHLHVMAGPSKCVALPPEVAERGLCAQLVGRMCGMRVVPSIWEALHTETLEKMGCERGLASACCFDHGERA